MGSSVIANQSADGCGNPIRLLYPQKNLPLGEGLGAPAPTAPTKGIVVGRAAFSMRLCRRRRQNRPPCAKGAGTGPAGDGDWGIAVTWTIPPTSLSLGHLPLHKGGSASSPLRCVKDAAPTAKIATTPAPFGGTLSSRRGLFLRLRRQGGMNPPLQNANTTGRPLGDRPVWLFGIIAASWLPWQRPWRLSSPPWRS